MKSRYEKFVLEAGTGVTFELLEENNTLIIRAFNTSESYAYPYMLNGYTHVLGEWDDGYIIQRNYDDSQLIWVPVEYLNYDSTFETKCKNPELRESVKKYGGFYISRYKISVTQEGLSQTVVNSTPLSSYNDAKTAAHCFSVNTNQKSCLIDKELYLWILCSKNLPKRIFEGIEGDIKEGFYIATYIK